MDRIYVVDDIDHLCNMIDKANRLQKAIVIDFFAPWCKSCKKIEKKFYELADILHEKAVRDTLL